MKKISIFILIYLAFNMLQAQTTIQFAGITWNVRNGSGGPGPNIWSDSADNVWVDSEGLLHLKIRKVGNTWYCSEIIAQQSFGYGEYRFYVASNVENYDPEIVAGLFTYETDLREIDIEFSKWGNPSNVAGWYTVQPVVAGNQHSFAVNLIGDYSTHRFIWNSNNIYFQSYHGHYPNLPSPDNLISEWTYTGKNIPPVGNERLHINFWLMGGHAPVNQQDAELVVKAVFVPSSSSIPVQEVSDEILVFPNPVVDKLNVQLPENSQDCKVSIYNSSGRKIVEQSAIKGKTEFDFGKYPAGVYYLKVFNNLSVEVIRIAKL